MSAADPRAARQNGRIDVHCHLLPGVDDGCATVAESIACGRALVEAGYTHIFCTPHVWPSLPRNTGTQIAAWVEKLQRDFDTAGVGLKLFGGGELNLLSGWKHLDAGPTCRMVTYGIAGRAVLFDFWADTWASCRDEIAERVATLQGLGLQCILAHPERVSATHDPGAVEWFEERGVKLQMNTWCLVERRGSIMYDHAARWLKEGRYFLLGTDLHNFGTLSIRLRGLKIAEELVGEEAIRQLTQVNPRTLLPGDDVDRSPVKVYEFKRA